MATAEFTVARTWQSDRRGPARWLLSHARRRLWLIAGLFIGALGNAALAAVMPIYTGQAFNAVLANPADINLLIWAAVMIAVTQIVRGIIQWGRNASSEGLSQLIERDVRDELYASLIGKSMAFHDTQPTGDLMARATNDVREINLLFNPGLNMVIGSANFLFMPIIFAPGIHPQLIVLPILYLIIYAILEPLYLRDLRPKAEQVRATFGKMNTTLAESIEGIETVKGTAQEEQERHRFLAAVEQWRRAYVAQADIEARFLPLLALGLLLGAGLGQSLLLFRAGEINVGDVIAFNGLLLLFDFPTFAAQHAYARVSSGMASARRILELMNGGAELEQNPDGYAKTMRGAVEFENVSFSYNHGQDNATLEKLNFTVSPGQTVAIVGQTGTGKSTIAKLLNRIYDVDAGRVKIDNVDVRDWNIAALRRQIAIIEQDIFLFSRTVADNIAFGAPNASREQIIEAARAAQAHDFILGFKDGYDTEVGERGVTLSGGQRQRLALARALLADPAILILDDATSAIDSETEDRIQRAIEAAASNRTTFLITHRLSQIRWADLIIVLRKGQIAGIGDHETLMRESPAYRAIFTRYES